MKKLTIAALIIAMISCNKDIEQREIPAFEPVQLDTLGGIWRTVHLTSGAEIPVLAPESVTSASYRAELDQIVSLQTGLTADDNRRIQTWKNSGVIKWNEVARELVAVYNLPPKANPDGTYPAPSAANPGAIPKIAGLNHWNPCKRVYLPILLKMLQWHRWPTGC
ncbi:MAG: hypothetical protein EAZ17_05340 [Sphingobacteriales bacterium]|nr:MAG: hypothetical protein EAZ17_05340 [Sphingobacteriales bacterium]